MYKYISVFSLGYNEGVKDALNDYNMGYKREFNIIDEFEIISKIYDIFYIRGYFYMYDLLKKSLN